MLTKAKNQPHFLRSLRQKKDNIEIKTQTTWSTLSQVLLPTTEFLSLCFEFV